MRVLGRYVLYQLRCLSTDTGGAELVEWVLVVSLVVLSGIAIYTGVLAPQLSSAIDTVGSEIKNVAPPGAS